MTGKFFMLFAAACISLQLAMPVNSNAKEITTPDDALKASMPDAKEIKVETKVLTDDQKALVETAGIKLDAGLDKELKVYTGIAGGKVVGNAVEVKTKGKWGPIAILVTIGLDNNVKDVAILSFDERRGAVVAKKTFLQQFAGKPSVGVLELNKDIKAVSGATISSRAVVSGVRKGLAVYNVLKAAKK